MAKVSVQYKVTSVYNIALYRKKTVEIKLPTNEYGFILFDSLTKELTAQLDEMIKSDSTRKIISYTIL